MPAFEYDRLHLYSDQTLEDRQWYLVGTCMYVYLVFRFRVEGVDREICRIFSIHTMIMRRKQVLGINSLGMVHNFGCCVHIPKPFSTALTADIPLAIIEIGLVQHTN